jgi:hypothetical protein
MNMLDNGLRAYENGSFGGWGGRVIKEQDDSNVFSMSAGATADEMAASLGSATNKQSHNERPYPNFFPQAQRDFANRLKWSVTSSYAAANHEPVARVEGLLTLLAAPGQKVPLYGFASDPDGDEVAVKWWQFHTGSYPGEVEITNPTSLKTDVLIPKDAVEGQTIHIVFEATDDGSPVLTSYRRVIIRVKAE